MRDIAAYPSGGADESPTRVTSPWVTAAFGISPEHRVGWGRTLTPMPMSGFVILRVVAEACSFRGTTERFVTTLIVSPGALRERRYLDEVERRASLRGLRGPVHILEEHVVRTGASLRRDPARIHRHLRRRGLH